MSSECAYSFWDLYREAEGIEATPQFRTKFFKMSQDGRNALVKKWAKKAGWGTEDRIGSDGLVYTAFSKTWIGPSSRGRSPVAKRNRGGTDSE